jgi:DNA-binding NarL/FixJ family response regulator
MTLSASPQPTAETLIPQTARSRALRVTVAAEDPITSDGVVAYLRSCPSLEVLDADAARLADTALVVAGAVTGQTVAAIERVVRESANEELPVVLIADSISRQLLVRAISHGLISFLTRSRTNLEQTVEALLDTRRGWPQLPTHIVTELVTQIRTSQHDEGGGNAMATEFTRREREVLSLVAEGMSTTEIAAKLNFAERTIKSVLHDGINRMHLKNRVHAVAYAIRSGAI